MARMFTRARLPADPRSRNPARSMLDLVEPRATVMQRHLYRSGFAGFQRPTTRALLASWEWAGPAPVFYDVGANSALYGALCKQLFPASSVVAFEPFPDSAAAARAVSARNHLDVTVEQRAVSNRCGRAMLHLSKNSDGSHSLVEGFKPEYGQITVETVTLDAYVAEGAPPPDVVKIDVEFHELDVLEGAAETIRRHRPVIVAEVVRNGHRDQGAAIGEMLQRHGYRAFRLTKTTDWHPRKQVTGKGRTKARDWLFFPEELPNWFPRRIEAWDRSLARCQPTLPQQAVLRVRRAKRALASLRRVMPPGARDSTRATPPTPSAPR